MPNTRAAIAGAILVTAIALPPARAQQCAPPPRCQAYSAKLQAYVANVQSKLRGDFIAAGAAAANFCVMKAAEELNNLCGKELQAKGEGQCAALAFAQAAEFDKNAEQSKAASEAMSAVSSSGWKANCGY